MAILNDITLGQYYPADSFVHRLDPRTKILVILSAMALFVIANSIVKLIVVLGVLLFIIRASEIPLLLVLKNLRPFFWLFLLTIIFHVFLTRQGELLVNVPLIKVGVTKPGLMNGLIYVFRLGILILLAAMLTLTTSPMEITDALDRFLKPLQKLGISTHEFTMMITLSLRFIPTLLFEADKLQKAQVSRGATSEGNLFQRIKGVIPLILPLFISVFRRADELALAMDARCYIGGKGRTSFKKLVFTRSDYLALTSSLLFVLCFLLIRF
jgi:energy-coupling factor transport system permease protein